MQLCGILVGALEQKRCVLIVLAGALEQKRCALIVLAGALEQKRCALIVVARHWRQRPARCVQPFCLKHTTCTFVL